MVYQLQLTASKELIVGVDINQSVVDTINRGEIHIQEPEFDSVVKDVVKNGFLKANTVAIERMFI